MNKFINSEKTCFLITKITANCTYKLSVSVDGIFHIRFSVKDEYNEEHLEWITKTIYGEDGNYTYVITPKTNGILSICKSKDRLNTWTALTVSVQEVPNEINV